jgi:hypothetical protein
MSLDCYEQNVYELHKYETQTRFLKQNVYELHKYDAVL